MQRPQPHRHALLGHYGDISLYERPGCSLLIDEGDNLDILNNPTLRSLFNSGYEHGGKIKRVIDGRLREFKIALLTPLPTVSNFSIVDRRSYRTPNNRGN